MGDFWDSFDPPEHNRAFARREVRVRAKRDRELRLLRSIWEGMSAVNRTDFKAGLWSLIPVQGVIDRASGGLLAAPNLATDTEGVSQWVFEEPTAPAVAHEVAKLRRDVFVCPEEYLCAIACWEAGEEYLPVETGLHPRWPVDPLRHFDDAPPAPDSPG